MTNFKTTQCGIFKLAKKIVEAEIGYSRETIEKLLKRFVCYGKIAYCEETKELMILNWMKYNFSSSKNTIACINKELKEIKHKEFRNILYKICVDRDYPVEEIFKDIEVDIDCDGENIKNKTECDEKDIYVNIEDEVKYNRKNACKDIEADTSYVDEGIEEEIDYDLENTFEVDGDEKIISPYEGAYKGLGEKETKKEKA
ncbi:hypothetical protein [Clostridium sp. OS1-26]|uniref:hypothetical protein n=1 Tax=Clostridium sp. OS1-26 TaxID=3070681 RepID=UPI0027E092CA|nr:hypothetical protein [Clostridium sp. OS1-26]WML34837.1 hypothetical protein RCG18_26900 [Clostridium sp. OS1-26]